LFTLSYTPASKPSSLLSSPLFTVHIHQYKHSTILSPPPPPPFAFILVGIYTHRLSHVHFSHISRTIARFHEISPWRPYHLSSSYYFSSRSKPFLQLIQWWYQVRKDPLSIIGLLSLLSPLFIFSNPSTPFVHFRYDHWYEKATTRRR